MSTASCIDWTRADLAAKHIVLAYELTDVMSDYAEDNPTNKAGVIAVMSIVHAYALLGIGMDAKAAIAQFGKTVRAVARVQKKQGKDCRLRDVLTEMSLDQGK